MTRHNCALFLTLMTGLASVAPALWGQAEFVYIVDNSPSLPASVVNGFSVDLITGALTPVPGLPLAEAGWLYPPAADPAGRFLYVPNSYPGGPNDILVFKIDPATGALAPVPGSPFAGFGPQSIAIHPTGSFAYSGGSQGGGVYSIDTGTGALTLIQQPFLDGTGIVAPGGKFLYMMQDLGVAVYAIDAPTGTLIPPYSIPSLGINLGSSGYFDAMAIHPTGAFAYLTEQPNESPLTTPIVLGLAIDPATGALSPLPGFPGAPLADTSQSIVVDPSGRFVYASNNDTANPDVAAFSVDVSTGALTPIAEANPGGPAYNLAVDCTGKFVFATGFIYNGTSKPFFVFSIDPVTGVLTQAAGSPYPDTANTNQVAAVAVACVQGVGLVSHVSSLPATETSPNFLVQWSGTDSSSTISSYTIYVSDNGGSFTAWLTQTAATQGTYTGVAGHTYGFYSTAQDLAGNVEPPKSAAEATTLVATVTPVSHVSSLPATERSLSFLVQWSGTDAASTISSYTIYVSDNGGSFTAWLTQTAATQGTYTGVAGHTYGFYSIAQDLAGNVEPPKSAAEATTLVDIVAPVSHVSSLPATETSPNFLVQWSGTDQFSAIKNYSIYVSDNGGPFTAWLTQTVAAQTWYAGFLGHTYGFFSQATDNAGNVENLKTVADATTQTPATSPEDVNGDGQINCADVLLVQASFAKKTGQPGFNPAADVNKDGVVNVLDLALVTQKLIPGTVCQ